MKNNIVQAEKRRILKKVRRDFIHKKCDEEEQKNEVAVPGDLGDGTFNIIDPSLYVVERNRKIYFGIHYVQSNYNITNITVDEAFLTNTVTINLERKIHNWPVEMGIKRLESYGDLGLATIGWKVRDHYTKYKAIMEKYLSLMQSQDPTIMANINKARNRAALMARDIESKYIYKKVLIFMDKDSSRIVSISYSKEIIENIGYNMEEFVENVRAHGLPCIFKGDSLLYHNIMKTTIDNFVCGKDFADEKPEFPVTVFDKHGVKKEVIGQCAIILEPVQEGVFVSAYVMIKRVNEAPENKVSLHDIAETNLKMKKCPKKERDSFEVEMTKAMNCESQEEMIQNDEQ